jgi:hypothetical protein
MDDRRLHGVTDDGHTLFDDAAVARRFQRRLRSVAPPTGYERPAMHYDESGYPIDDRRASLAARVRRLITGG